MLSIRLTRVGKKKQPSYRIIVLDKKKDPWGKYLENLGFYNPRTNPKTIDLKVDRIKYWISKGAQASATVNNMLVDAGILTTKVKSSSVGKKKAEEPKVEVKKETPAPEVKPEEAKIESPVETPTEAVTETVEVKPEEEAKTEAPKPEETPVEEKPAEPEAQTEPTEETK